MVAIIDYEFRPVVTEEMPYKDTFYLELWWSLCSGEQKHLCNFGREHHEEHFCKIILNFKWTSG